MSDLDDVIRQVVRSLATAVTEPPALPDLSNVAAAEPADTTKAAGLQWRNAPAKGRLVALVAAVVVFVAGGVLAARLVRDDRPDIAAVGPAVVRYQRVRYELTADLSCDGASGAGSTTLTVETWQDVKGGRVYQRASYSDGSLREAVFVGPPDRPEKVYGRGESGLAVPTCWGQHALLDDATDATVPLLFAEDPSAVPSIDETTEGMLVPEIMTDSEGRAVQVRRSIVDGFLTDVDGLAPGEEVPIRQTNDRYVDPSTGVLREVVWTDEASGQYQVRESLTVLATETREVDPAIFDTDGYQLTYDLEAELGDYATAEPAVPTTEIGGGQLWLPSAKAASAAEAGSMFGRQVLRWDTTLAPADQPGQEPGPTFLTISDGSGHEVPLLALPTKDRGWALQQASGLTTSMRLGPDGDTLIDLPSTAGSDHVAIHVRTAAGELLAWRATTPPGTPAVLLPAIAPEDIANMLIVVFDDKDNGLTAGGG